MKVLTYCPLTVATTRAFGKNGINRFFYAKTWTGAPHPAAVAAQELFECTLKSDILLFATLIGMLVTQSLFGLFAFIPAVLLCRHPRFRRELELRGQMIEVTAAQELYAPDWGGHMMATVRQLEAYPQFKGYDALEINRLLLAREEFAVRWVARNLALIHRFKRVFDTLQPVPR